MVFESVLNPVLSPLLTLEPIIAIFIISLFITLLTTLAYKYLTDQKRLKELKAEMKKYQEKLKKLKDQPDKAMKLQKEMMSKNGELMKLSMRPTLYTLVPLLIIFGWLNAHMAFMPLVPDQPFEVSTVFIEGTTGQATLSATPVLMVKDGAVADIIDNKATWLLSGSAGDYRLSFDQNGTIVSKDITITDKPGVYEQPVTSFKNEGSFKQVIVGNTKIKPLEGVPIFGNWGWLGIYIVLSILLSFGMRKALNVT